MAENSKKFYEKFVKKNGPKKKTDSVKTETAGENKKKPSIFAHGRTNKAPVTETGSSRRGRKVENLQPASSKKNLFESLTAEQSFILNSFFDIANSVLKLNSRQEKETHKNIKVLFHELTDERSARKLTYLNNPVKLSAYIFHYMWWNLFRLVKLFNSLDLEPEDGSAVGDFGCGPLTAVCALWIAKPNLRQRNLTFYCVDISAKALTEGEKIFASLCAFTEQRTKRQNLCKEKHMWNIVKIAGGFGIPLKQKLSLFISANMFNEIFWDSSATAEFEAKKAARVITRYLKDCSKILVVEPGIPLAGRFISFLRMFLMKEKCTLYSPCPHSAICPIPGGKNELRKKDFTALGKWCHFSFDVKEAPPNLVKFSAAVKLEKNTASLSFVFAGFKDFSARRQCKENEESGGVIAEAENPLTEIVITSNIIKLPHEKIGRYACSEKGFLLLAGRESGSSVLKKCNPGSYFKLNMSNADFEIRDPKTNALLVNVY